MTVLNRRQLALFQRAMLDLEVQAGYDVQQVFRLLRNEAFDPVFAREALQDIIPSLVERYGDVAQGLANEWFVALDPHDGFQPDKIEPIPHEQASNSAAWAAQAMFDGQPDVTLDRLHGAVQRFVYNQARDTITMNARRMGVPWARVTRADGCAFCRMLASRGFVYESEKKAGSGAGSSHYHDRCRCTVIPKRKGISEQDVPNLSKFRAQYYQARGDLTDTSANRGLILARMRT